jgi:hypothetical protein
LFLVIEASADVCVRSIERATPGTAALQSTMHKSPSLFFDILVSHFSELHMFQDSKRSTANSSRQQLQQQAAAPTAAAAATGAT